MHKVAIVAVNVLLMSKKILFLFDFVDKKCN